MDTAEAKEDIKEAIGDCPVCLEPILDPPIHQVFWQFEKWKNIKFEIPPILFENAFLHIILDFNNEYIDR